MSTTPRIIAATASAALLAGLGAGTAVLAVDTVMADGQTDAAQVTADDNLPTPQDERTTVYQEPQQYEYDDDDDDEGGQIAPAPPTTGFQGNNGGQTKNNTSKSS
ncbi:MAG: hypothetical protein U0R27_08115 [Candidatus Nanopelagicales bacterium]|nr:hypothetical protein [Actinomycetota bacterium]MCB0921733.1 hypothetical protein [Actinomycetota bacterium]HUM87408.1 hypothetical protein [Actinomycetota bacterium]